MNYLIRIAGAVFVLAGTLFAVGEYEKLLVRRAEICNGFIALLSHIRRRIDGYLASASGLLEGFECSALDAYGYSERAREIGVGEAYFEFEKAFPLTDKLKKSLSGFFHSFGKDYMSGTLKALDVTLDEIKALERALSAENEKNLKVARTLALAAALGVIILLI